MSKLLAFVMDPVERVNVATDTTFAFMLAAEARGHRLLYVAPKDLGLEGAELFLWGREVHVRDEPGRHVELGAERRVAASELDAVFLRTDPPFDADYLTASWLLSFGERAGLRVINSPQGVRDANEKLYALEFPELCPKTLVTSRRADVFAFMVACGGEAIAKPIDGHGGYGVLRLREGDSNVAALVDMLTAEGRRPVMLQEYLPAARAGDKRLLFVDGALVGAIVRVPSAGDHRSNVHVGGSVAPAAIDDDDRRIAERLGPRLRAQGLFFVGADVIGGKLTEVNVTSPTLVRELARLGGPDLAARVIEAL